MPTSNLPVELWLEVLSYLPHGFYQAVHFASDDKETMDVFRLLKHGIFARRVQCLHIQPEFLPMSNKGFKSQNAFRRKVVVASRCLKRHAFSLLDSGPPTSIKETWRNHPNRVLKTAKETVKHCHNIQELKITFHDWKITSAFISFMDSLWAPKTTGPNVTKLSIDTPFATLPLFLSPLVRLQASGTLMNLREFELELFSSKFKISDGQWEKSHRILLSFFTAFKDALSSVTLSNKYYHEHRGRSYSRFFESCPHLPKLEEFRFLALMECVMIANHESASLTKFLSKHASSLKRLVIGPHASRTAMYRADRDHLPSLCPEFLHPQTIPPLAHWQLVLPNLYAFDTSFRSSCCLYKWNTEQLLPDLSRVMPNLTKLFISEIQLSDWDLCTIVDSLRGARSGRGSILEELEYTCNKITPQVFDMLAQKLPKLKSLRIKYDQLSVLEWTSDTPRRFYEVMRKRKYPSWALAYLRLEKLCDGVGEPDILAMEAVTASLTQDVVLDVTTR